MDVASIINAEKAPIQDFIILDGKRSPGRATLSSASTPRVWDKMKGWGYSGASLVYIGQELAEFEVVIDLWEDEHWAQWATFSRVLMKEPIGVRAGYLSIVHPLLNRAPLHIVSVVIRDVSQFEQSKSGLWTCRIAMTEGRERKAALGKPVGTIPGTGGAIDPFADDPQIKALMKKQADLGGIL